MANPKLVEDYLSQADSLTDVLQYQCGDGAASLVQAASLLRSAKRVVIAGMGASLYGSIPFEYFLCAHGIDAVAVEAGEFLHYRHAGFQDAVAVVVSRSGQSVEITRLLEKLKGRVPVIGVSNEPGSVLARDADVSIAIGSRDDDIVAHQTYTGTLLALHLLAGEVIDESKAAREAILGLLPEFRQLVSCNFAGRGQWKDFFRIGSPMYFLARGPSCASAYEGALLFNEVAKAPAVAMAAGSFRHGPVEVVDPDFRGIVFAPQGNTRGLNLALASDLVRFGGRIQIIGPALEAATGRIDGCQIPELPDTLAPLMEIVPVQAAALCLAELKGIPPGSFRFAPRVAVDEASFVPRKEG